MKRKSAPRKSAVRYESLNRRDLKLIIEIIMLLEQGRRCLMVLKIRTGCLLGGSVLLSAWVSFAQPLQFSEPVRLPEGFGGPESVVTSVEGEAFVAVTSRLQSHRTTDVFMAVVDGSNSDLLDHWQATFHLPKDIELLRHPDGVVLAAYDEGEIIAPDTVNATFYTPLEGPFPSSHVVLNPIGTSPTSYDAAGLGAAGMVFVWSDLDPNSEGVGPPGLMLQDLSPQGELLGEPRLLVEGNVIDPQVAAGSLGGYFVIWQEVLGGAVLGRVFSGTGQVGPTQILLEEGGGASQLALESLPSGEYLLAWIGRTPEGIEGVLTLRLSRSGVPVSDPLVLSQGAERGFVRPRVASDRLGRAWVVWQETRPTGESEVFLQLILSDGRLGSGRRVPPVAEDLQLGPDVATHDAGAVIVVWGELGAEVLWQARTVETHAVCEAGDTSLCLHQGRFQVEVAWEDFEGRSGLGHSVSYQTSESGLFWFFNPRNWEVMVKVIDGCDFNGHFWVFSAATTDVAFDLTVQDTLSGLQRTYSNRLGVPAPANTDVFAFPSCPE